MQRIAQALVGVCPGGGWWWRGPGGVASGLGPAASSWQRAPTNQ